MTTKEFKIWDEQNATGSGGKSKIRQNFITFLACGKINFSAGLCKALGITKSTRITFVEGDDGSFFLCKTKDSGLLIINAKHSHSYLSAGARKLTEHLMEKLGLETSFRARVSIAPETFPRQEGMPVAGYRVYLNEVKK